MDASIEAKKILILTKKPIIGGSPAIENKTVLNKKAKILLDLLSKFKSVNSLFCFFVYWCFSGNNKKIDQTHKLAPI